MLMSSISRNVKELPKPKDQGFNAIFADINDKFNNAGLDVTNSKAFESVYTHPTKYQEYVNALIGDIANESAKEALGIILEHDREMLLNSDSSGYVDESNSSANVHMYSFLNGPVIRAIWARSIVPSVMRTIPLKQTKYTATFDIPYLVKGGKRYDLPYSIIDEEEPVLGLTSLVPKTAAAGGAAHIGTGSFVRFPAGGGGVSGNIIMESIDGATLADYRHVDPRITISDIQVTSVDAAGAEVVTETTIVAGIRPSSKSGKASSVLLSREFAIVNLQDPDTEFGTLFVTIDLETGKYDAATTSKYIKGFKFNAKLSSEDNRSAGVMRSEQHAIEVTIGLGEHVMIDTPVELLQDYSQAHSGADYVVAMTDIISEFYAGLQNKEFLSFMKASFQKTHSDFIPENVLRSSNQPGTFDIRVAHGTNPAAYTDVQLKRAISWYVNSIKSTTRIEDGFWSIVGHANNVMYIPDFKTESFGQTEANSDGGAEVYGFKVGYTLGFTTNITNGKIRALYSPEIKLTDGLIGFFSSVDDRRPTYVYHPYAYTVSRGYQNASNALLPSIMVTKRHAFEDFIPSQFRLALTGNDGTQFTTPHGVPIS